MSVSNWQLALSARPKRSDTAGTLAVEGAGGAILYEFLQLEKDGELVHVVQETHRIAHQSVREGKSGPPLHIHLHQSEHFEVLSGTLGLVLNGQQHALQKDGRVSIPAGARHTFWAHTTSTEDVKFHCWVKPQNVKNGLDEGFLRNFAGYLVDCERENIQPSLFQLLLFLWEADIVLTPPFWLPSLVLRGLHFFLATIVGQYLLGYRASYPEYWRQRMDAISKKTI